MKSPIEQIREYQEAAGCNNKRFMWWIRKMIENNPDCCVSKRMAQIIEEQDGDDYLSRAWILREYDLVDAEGWFDDAVFWYGNYKEAIK